MSLADLGLTTRDVDLGSIDAESDDRLAEHFIETPYVDDALAGRSLLLGRKGSGKSALFTQLPRLAEQNGMSVEVSLLTPNEYAWAAIREYEEQGLLPELAHTNAWKLTIAFELAGHIATVDRDWSESAHAAVNRLSDFVKENFGYLEPDLVTTATGLIKGLTSFNLNAFGFGAGFEREAPDERKLTPAIIKALYDTIAIPLREAGVIVAFDRLDDSWDGSEASQTLLIGLLKAAKDINDGFGLHDDVGLRTVVFLRSDIYDTLRFDDKDKHRSSESHILWDATSLKEMLTRRLPDGLEADGLFVEDEMRGRITPFNYIVKRTFLRPREILQFTSLALAESGGQDAISKEAIRSAENIYSNWKIEDLVQEMRRVSPRFEELIEALRQEVHRYDSIDELSELLEKNAPEAVEEVGGTRKALVLLFDASVIGIRLRGAGSTKFKSEEPQLQLPAEGAVYVHQGLYRGLNIVEARRQSDDEPADEDEAIKEEV